MSGKYFTGPQLDSVPISTLGEFFFQATQKFKNRTSHVDAGTDRHETYSSLNRRSTRVALAMMKLGITPQDVVVVCSTVTLDTPVPVLAAFYIGAKVANLDPTLSVRQTSHLLSLVSPKIIFVEEGAVDLIEKSSLEAKLGVEIVVFGESTKYTKFSSLDQAHLNENDFRPKSIDVEETGLIFFSSGSTGLPKAICHSHRSFLTCVFRLYKSGMRFDTTLSFTTFYWISGMIFMTIPFIEGSRRIICGSTVNAKQVFHCIETYKVTFLFLAPVLTYELTDFPNYTNYDTSSLHSFLTGGTSMSTSQFYKIRTVFEHSNLVFGYGLTEVGITTIFNPVTDKELMMKKIGSSGKAIFGYTLKVVDVKTNETLGPNQKGEICIKSSTIMNGYYGAESTEVFDDEGFFKTGDLGYFDEDSCLYIAGRLKEMFKYLSWHIVPAAIEDVLYEHPAVKNAVVFGLPKNEEEGELPTACVVVKDDSNVTEKEIEDFVAERVSDREKLRGGVYFMEELARTSTGKVMRRKIREDVIQRLKNN